MAKCISHHQSERFIKYLNKSGIPIRSYPNWFRTYMNYSKRSLNKIADDIGLILTEYKETVKYPRYCLLDLEIDNQQNKHANNICIDKDNDGYYTLEFFEPNGELNPDNKNDKAIINLVELVSLSLETKLLNDDSEQKNIPIIFIRDGKRNLNFVGQGNCDAISLHYITLRSVGSIDKVNKKLDSYKMDYKDITFINDTIINFNKRKL
jgi:hypothetical protein